MQAVAPRLVVPVRLGTCEVSRTGWRVLTNLLGCWADGSPGAGTWVRSSSPHLTFGNWPCSIVEDYVGKSCGNTNQRQLPLSYEWKPSPACDPQPPPWSKHLLCAHHAGDILVVGDSLSHHFWLTLHMALGASCQNVVTCNATHNFRISYIRNDHLLMTNESCFDRKRNVMMFPWYDALLRSPNIGTVVLHQLFHSLRRDRPDLLVVYRNTPAGHHDCWKGSGVLGPPTEWPYQSWAEGKPDPYHWRALPQQNRLVEALLRDQFPGVVYWDVEQATAFRQDSHPSPKDCLHYCVPGPINHWVEAFGQLMWAVQRQCKRAERHAEASV